MINWRSDKDKIIVEDLPDFDPEQTFECGQCFRWRKTGGRNWQGVAGGHAAELEWDGRDLVFLNTGADVFKSFWFPYFDFGTDYTAIKEKLAKNDPVMEEAIRLGSGIRLLRQDFYEMALSFIISQNNNIPRISKIIACLAENFGDPITIGGKIDYSFPSVGKIAALESETLSCARAGYRTGYLIKASRQMAEGLVDVDGLKQMKIADARLEMLKLHGVGEKVADCILLFSGVKRDVFPVDRWIARVMASLYPGCGIRNEEIAAFAREKFGENAGIAQQYLFYYARETKIGIDSRA